MLETQSINSKDRYENENQAAVRRNIINFFGFLQLSGNAIAIKPLVTNLEEDLKYNLKQQLIKVFFFYLVVPDKIIVFNCFILGEFVSSFFEQSY